MAPASLVALCALASCQGRDEPSGTSSGGASSGGTSTGVSSPLYTGRVVLITADAGSMNPHFASASLVPTASDLSCPGGTPSGACCYLPPSSRGGPTPSVSAGLLTLDDASASIGTLAFAGSSYSLSSSPSALTWKTGDKLTVSGAGATVDAFSASAVAPTGISGLAPAIAGDTLLISNTTDWALSWTPDPLELANEGVVVTLTDEVSGATLSCGAADSAGVLTFPAALLGNFSAGSVARVAVDRSSDAIASAANAVVHIQPTTEQPGTATFSDGPISAFAGTVTMTAAGLGSSAVYAATAEFATESDAGLCAEDCCIVPATPAIPSFNAGEITLQDGTPTIGILSFSNQRYALTSSPSILTWQGGDTLGVSAFGNVVLPFSAVVTAPSAITGLNPSLAGGPVAIAIDSDWALSWTPDSLNLRADNWESESMRVTLSDGDAGQAICNVADSAGSLTLPTTVLGALRGGDTVTIAVERHITSSVSDFSGNPPVTTLISAVAALTGSATLK